MMHQDAYRPDGSRNDEPQAKSLSEGTTPLPPAPHTPVKLTTRHIILAVVGEFSSSSPPCWGWSWHTAAAHHHQHQSVSSLPINWLGRQKMMAPQLCRRRVETPESFQNFQSIPPTANPGPGQGTRATCRLNSSDGAWVTVVLHDDAGALRWESP